MSSTPSKWQNPFARTAFPAQDNSPAFVAGTHAVDEFTGRPAETADRIARMQHMLSKKLGPEYLSTRQGGGGTKLTYIEGWRVINLANEIFGFNGWFTEVKSIEVDFIDFNPETNRFNIGVSAVVRVWLRDGGGHEDVGYGKLENTKSKADGLDKCKKEAVTDALKRTLRNFGSVLGNCLYDKHYTAEIAKMKAPKAKFDTKDLLRPADTPYRASASTSIAVDPALETAMSPPKSNLSSKPSMPPPPVPQQRASSHAPPPKTVPPRAPPSRPPQQRQQPPPQRLPQQQQPPPQCPQQPFQQQQANPYPGQRPNPLDRPQTADLFAGDGDDDALFANVDLDVGIEEGDSEYSEGGGLPAYDALYNNDLPGNATDRPSPPTSTSTSSTKTPLQLAQQVKMEQFQQQRRLAQQRSVAPSTSANPAGGGLAPPQIASAACLLLPPHLNHQQPSLQGFASPKPGLRPAQSPTRRPTMAPTVQGGQLPSLGNVGAGMGGFTNARGVKRGFDAAGAGAAGGGGGGGVGEGGNEPDEWRHPLGEVELGIAGEVKRPRVGDPGM